MNDIKTLKTANTRLQKPDGASKVKNVKERILQAYTEQWIAIEIGYNDLGQYDTNRSVS